MMEHSGKPIMPARLPLKNLIPTDLPLITANYHVLHFDEEPILFTGTNKYGNRIIASLVDESDEEGLSWYFHVIVDPRTYTNFRKRKLSYLEVLRECQPIYIVERRFGDAISKIYFSGIDDIPEYHLPMDDSYCPEQTYNPVLTYSVRLRGLLADTNAALPKDISAMQTAFAEQLESNVVMLKNIVRDAPIVVQRAYTQGSFQLNFDIQVQLEDMFTKNASVAQYINEFIEYCAEHLPSEAEKIYEPEPEKLPFFGHLIQEYEQLYSKSGVKLPEKYKEKVRDEVKKASESIADMTEMIGERFTGMEIVNEGDTSQPLAYFDTDFKQTIESVVEIIQEKTQKVEEDSSPQRYEIWVYHLNKESRTGNANIINEDQDRKMSRPKIKISGDEPLENTKYTASLHLNMPIQVLAKAKRVDGKFRSLDIEFEQGSPF
jgi:hypothetical protein